MSACQSQPNAGSSCSTGTAPPAVPFTLPEGASPITVSDAVVNKVGEMLSEEGDPNLKLRIFVTGGGCSGFQYNFSFEEARNEDDLVIEHDGAAVLVDSTSLEFLKGSQLDYVEEMVGSAFQVKNPNATSSCGCGNSFSV